MNKLNANLNADVNVNDLINDVAGEPINEFNTTLVSIWKIVFGKIEYFSHKKEYERKQNLELFKKQVDEKIAQIPVDKKQEPSIAIIGPSIKSSEFFFEESHYREMFSRIIAGSFNSDYNTIMHPAYAQIITELSKNDALTLKYLYDLRDNSKSLIARRLEICNLNKIPKDSLYPNCVMTRKAFSNLDPLSISFSLSNLQRLNLITITDSIYGVSEISKNDQFQNAPLLKKFRTEHQNVDFKLHPMQVNLTTLGKSFSKICLDKPL